MEGEADRNSITKAGTLRIELGMFHEGRFTSQLRIELGMFHEGRFTSQLVQFVFSLLLMTVLL